MSIQAFENLFDGPPSRLPYYKNIQDAPQATEQLCFHKFQHLIWVFSPLLLLLLEEHISWIKKLIITHDQCK